MSDQFDYFFDSMSDVSAIVREETLEPVNGKKSITFPPTYAKGGDNNRWFPGGYNIDPPIEKGKPAIIPNICAIDSIQSQANRMEPIFAQDEFAELIPQVEVHLTDEDVLNLVDIPHRIGDASVRYGNFQNEINNVFKEMIKGNAEPLAKLAPTSLVFGVWDSRDTKAKVIRIVASRIDAYDVRLITRSAQYTPPIDYKEKGLAVINDEKALSELGMDPVPCTGALGGVIVDGKIERNTIINLAALRRLKSTTKEKTLKLQRYILGLSLVAVAFNRQLDLRSGCLLRLSQDNPPVTYKSLFVGENQDFSFTAKDALEYAKIVAKDFGVGENRKIIFDAKKIELARKSSKSKKNK